MNKCKMCGELFPFDDGCEADNICETCFVDSFDCMDLEDKLGVLLK